MHALIQFNWENDAKKLKESGVSMWRLYYSDEDAVHAALSTVGLLINYTLSLTVIYQ